MREQRLMSSMASEKSGPGPGTKVGSVPQGRAPMPQPSNVLKTPYTQPGADTVPSSDAKRSQEIPAQGIELVVIANTESD
jgi:hypothetical protein